MFFYTPYMEAGVLFCSFAHLATLPYRTYLALDLYGMIPTLPCLALGITLAIP